MPAPDQSNALPDLVILVHGTFAGSADDEGPGWWQRTSDHWQWLHRHLPPGVELLDDSVRLFHWDGRNSQISRLRAGNRLLALMLELEAEGRNYHVVGHSHGGSVIWEALVTAEITRLGETVYAELRRAMNDPSIGPGRRPAIPERPDEYAPFFVKHKTRFIPRRSEFAAVRDAIRLSGLRSWTTVGTPFMHYLPARRPLVTGWRSNDLSLGPTDERHALIDSLRDLLVTTAVTLPVFFIASLVIASLVGARWPAAFFDSRVADSLALPYVVCWLLAFWVMGKRAYAGVLLNRAHAARSAAQRFCGRWLGLWSPSDEAINALSATTRHDVTYEWLNRPARHRAKRVMPALPSTIPMPRLAIPPPISTVHLVPDVLLIAPRRLTGVATTLANRWLEPRWRRWAGAAITRAVQGSDLPSAVAAYVSPWPLPLADARAHPGLPDSAVARIEELAAGHNATLGPAARQLLMISALEGVGSAVQAAGDGVGSGTAGLVHTAYFADEEVRRLILHHIGRTRTSAGPDATIDEGPWLPAHQAAVQARIAQFLAETSGEGR